MPILWQMDNVTSVHITLLHLTLPPWNLQGTLTNQHELHSLSFYFNFRNSFLKIADWWTKCQNWRHIWRIPKISAPKYPQWRLLVNLVANEGSHPQNPNSPLASAAVPSAYSIKMSNDWLLITITTTVFQLIYMHKNFGCCTDPGPNKETSHPTWTTAGCVRNRHPTPQSMNENRPTQSWRGKIP